MRTVRVIVPTLSEPPQRLSDPSRRSLEFGTTDAIAGAVEGREWPPADVHGEPVDETEPPSHHAAEARRGTDGIDVMAGPLDHDDRGGHIRGSSLRAGNGS